MVRVEKSIEIKAPPEKVWEMLAFDRFPEWMDSVKGVSYTSEVRTSEDKYRVCASAHVIAEEGEFDLEIIEKYRKREDFESLARYGTDAKHDCKICPETLGSRN